MNTSKTNKNPHNRLYEGMCYSAFYKQHPGLDRVSAAEETSLLSAKLSSQEILSSERTATWILWKHRQIHYFSAVHKVRAHASYMGVIHNLLHHMKITALTTALTIGLLFSGCEQDDTSNFSNEIYYLEDIIVRTVQLNGIEIKGSGELDKPLFDTLSNESITINSSQLGFLITPRTRISENDVANQSSGTKDEFVPKFTNPIESYSIFTYDPKTQRTDSIDWLKLLEISPSKYLSYINLNETRSLFTIAPWDEYLLRFNFTSDTIFKRRFVYRFELSDGTEIEKESQIIEIIAN